MEHGTIATMKYLMLFFVLLMPFTVNADDETDALRSLNYIPANYQNMSRLPWKYNLHDISDDAVINEYFQIENCDLYNQYHKNDFVWQGIKEAKKRDIRYFSNQYPDRFEVIASLPISRYDFNKAAFLIEEEFALKNAGSIQIPISYDKIALACPDILKSENFPISIKFIADNKFSLMEIPVEPDRANDILLSIKKYKFKNTNSDRIVSVRFRFKTNTIDRYQVKSNASEIVYRGQLDEIAFFEDPERTKLIWKKQFKILD